MDVITISLNFAEVKKLYKGKKMSLFFQKLVKKSTLVKELSVN